MNRKFLLTLFFISSISLVLRSQLNDANLRIEFKLDTASAAIDSNNNYLSSTRYEVIYHLAVTDYLSIDKVELQMGTSYEGNQYFSYRLDLNDDGFPRNISLVKLANELVVSTGKYALSTVYYARARFKFTNGTYSEWMRISNAE